MASVLHASINQAMAMGRSRKKVFEFIKDRMWKRIQRWSMKCLSKAGKVVLLRNVAQVIPTYAMSCFLLPKSLCQELERMMNSFWWGSKNNNRKSIKWLSWENMSMSKCKGGLGFRDLRGFNIALLGKICWNFIRNPSSLVARIFKARYFSNTSLFDASRGGGVSFVWSGLWQAKELLKKGYRWVLGNGEDIRIFEDAWLKSKPDFRVDSDNNNRGAVVKACELFILGDKKWETQKVNNLFSDCDDGAILETPIPRGQVCDRLAWTEAPDGKFTVKAGYRFWHSNYSTCRQVNQGDGWKELWKLEVPHKVRIFLWRLCMHNIPVRNLLRGRGVQTTILCHMCVVDVEHPMPLFFDCQFAKGCWNYCDLDFDVSTSEYISEWLLEKFAHETQEMCVLIATILWGIWYARNQKVWEQKTFSANMIVQGSMHQVSQWKEARKSKHTVVQTAFIQRFDVKWKASSEGRFKLNVDASLFPGMASFTLGLVIRDHRGTFIQAKNMRVEGSNSVMETEVRGILEALVWLQELDMKNVDIECDCLLAVNALCHVVEYITEVGHSLDECKEVLRNRLDFSVSFVKRQANKVAHLLAREPCVVG